MTVQYARFIERRLVEHEFQILHICAGLREVRARRTLLLGDRQRRPRRGRRPVGVSRFTPFWVHAHYKSSSVELLFARSAEEAFRGKYAAALTTSIHFFDHTAHNYVHAISEDLGMRYVGSFSAMAYDLLEEKEKLRLVQFVQGFLDAIAEQRPVARIHDPLRPHGCEYSPSPARDGDARASGSVNPRSSCADARGSGSPRMLPFTPQRGRLSQRYGQRGGEAAVEPGRSVVAVASREVLRRLVVTRLQIFELDAAPWRRGTPAPVPPGPGRQSGSGTA